MKTLVVSEIFGPTIQGEGVYAGQIVGFIRLGACNLSCSWCDTPYTWDATRFDLRNEMVRTPVSEILESVKELQVKAVVISGGEPLLQQKQDGWNALLDGLFAAGIKIHIETNGTIVPAGDTILKIQQFSVSPKLAHGGDSESKRINREALDTFTNLSDYHDSVIFKFVAQQESDLEEIAKWVKDFHLPEDKIWVMPEGATREEQLTTLQRIADGVIARRWNLTTRLHTLIWDLRRGV